MCGSPIGSIFFGLASHLLLNGDWDVCVHGHKHMYTLMFTMVGLGVGMFTRSTFLHSGAFNFNLDPNKKGRLLVRRMIRMKDFPFLYHARKWKIKNLRYRLVKAQNAEVIEAIFMKAGGILMPDIHVEEKKIFRGIVLRYQHLWRILATGFREEQFIFQKKYGPDLWGQHKAKVA